MRPRAFLELSDAGGDTDTELRRSSVELIGSLKLRETFGQGRRLANPGPKLRLKVNPPVPLEDMPWSGDVPVVSDRFRRFLEDHAPKHAQYFEITAFAGPKKLIPAQPYFYVNWLKLVDAIDFSKSQYDDDDGSFTFFQLVLDPSRVPENVRIFRLRHSRSKVVIDKTLADEIRRAGFTGPQFYKVTGLRG